LIKALIFDFDGLIIDTESADYQAWLEIYREHGLDYPVFEFQKIIGIYSEIPVPLDQLDALISPLDRDAVDARRSERSREKALQQPLLPGVLTYLKHARALGLRTAIASSSPRNWLDRFLEPRNLMQYFDFIITGDTVSQVKPSPELFNTALGKLGQSPGEALVFEDSYNGLKAARAAGIRCVIIPGRLTRGMDFHDADLVLDSLDAMSLDDVLELLNGI
jgi:putative hydrolase of the HAD superfamily